MATENGTLGTRLRLERRRANMTLEQLADVVGISTSFLAYIERGQREPGLNTARALAGALRLPLAELFQGPPDGAGDPIEDASVEFAQLLRGLDKNQIASILKLVRLYVDTLEKARRRKPV